MKTPRPSPKPRPRRAGRLSLRLYVAGQLPGSVNAERDLRTLFSGPGTAAPKLEIVDLLQEPERALTDGIMVTPTLVRLSPKPEVRILGALADLSRVRSVLGLRDRSKGGHD